MLRIPPSLYSCLAQSTGPLYLASAADCWTCSKHLMRSPGAMITVEKTPATIPAPNNWIRLYSEGVEIKKERRGEVALHQFRAIFFMSWAMQWLICYLMLSQYIYFFFHFRRKSTLESFICQNMDENGWLEIKLWLNDFFCVKCTNYNCVN